jgi:dihydrofolate reductase
MSITIIAAVAENGVIGNKGKIPWYLPEDFKHFKKTTENQVVIMGRKTYESLPEKVRPLPNRVNIVVSSGMEPQKGIEIARNYDEAIQTAKLHKKEIFVIGGSSLFEAALSNADRMLLSEVKGTPEGDVFFPKFDKKEWKITSEKQFEGFKLVEYQRK